MRLARVVILVTLAAVPPEAGWRDAVRAFMQSLTAEEPVPDLGDAEVISMPHRLSTRGMRLGPWRVKYHRGTTETGGISVSRRRFLLSRRRS